MKGDVLGCLGKAVLVTVPPQPRDKSHAHTNQRDQMSIQRRCLNSDEQLKQKWMVDIVPSFSIPPRML
jgi:hypothetical protein